MLKTGLKSFVYSFSVSLFAIVSANRAFFYEKKAAPYDLDIQNKSIALYLADTRPSYVPVKKIELNSLPELQKKQDLAPPPAEPEIIVASNLESLDIPIEFVENNTVDAVEDNYVPTKQEIALADVLYAPDKPLPMPEIEAEPVYQPADSLEIKIASAPVYTPKIKPDTNIIAPPPPQQIIKEEQVVKEDNSLLVARTEPVGNIPLIQTQNNVGVNKVQLGNPDDLQHVAFASNSVPIQSMSVDKTSKEHDAAKNKEWKQMSSSPWVVAKSTGSKNLFANKTDKEIAGLIPLENDKKGVLIASETPKNLIIPIPEDILNKEDLTPQLAYPITSDDKKKEIDINAKIKEAEEKKKATEEEKTEKVEEENKQSEIVTAIEEDVVLTVDTPPPPPVEKVDTPTPPPPATNNVQKENFMNAISSIFNKTAQTVSEATDKVIEKAKEKKNRFSRKRAKNKPVTIMPAEIRLAFQPNRAEISGQTLRWIQAFATKTAQTPGMMLEIRIDGTSSTKLQQNRLNLLYNILTNKGVDYSMINTVFTARDPNSFILRAITTQTDNNKQGVNNQKTDRYIQW